MASNPEQNEINEVAPQQDVNEEDQPGQQGQELKRESPVLPRQILHEVLSLSDWSAIRKRIAGSDIKSYLPPEHRRLWLEQIKKGDGQAFQAAITERLPYIVSCLDTFQRFIPQGSEKEVLADAIAAAAEYFQAETRSDYTEGEAHRTRLYGVIKLAIMKSVARFSNFSLGANEALLKRAFDLLFYKETFYFKYGRSPSGPEIREFLSAGRLGEEALQDTLRAVQALETGAGRGERRVDEERVESPENLEVLIKRDLLASELERGLTGALNEREAEILRLRYGLKPADKLHTLREVSDAFNISRERVRTIEIRAIEKLQLYFKKNKPMVRGV